MIGVRSRRQLETESYLAGLLRVHGGAAGGVSFYSIFKWMAYESLTPIPIA